VNKQPLRCIHCGGLFRREAGAGLCCGPGCEDKYKATTEQNRKALADAGFVQHPETPNIWHKDGVAVTEEQVKHHGIEKTIHLHAGAVAEHAARV